MEEGEIGKQNWVTEKLISLRNMVIKKDRVTLEEREEGNIETNVYTVTIRDAVMDLGIDWDFIDNGMVPVPNTPLVNFKTTEELFGRVPGIKPETFLERIKDGVLAICPTNFGWQEGCILVQNGQLILIKNDRDGKVTAMKQKADGVYEEAVIHKSKKLSGKFNVFAQCEVERDGEKKKEWEVREVELKEGKVLIPEGGEDPLKGILVGFSMPKIVDNGRVVGLKEIIGDPRLMADLRNVFDFGFGHGTNLPDEYWVLIKNFLPRSEAQARAILEGKTIEVTVDDKQQQLTRKQFKRMQQIIKDNNLGYALSLSEVRSHQRRWYQVWDYLPSRRGSVSQQLRITGGTLKPNRMPIVVIGIGEDKNLIITLADGRWSDNAGLSISEAAECAIANGAVVAGLGSAGGDEALVVRMEEEIPDGEESEAQKKISCVSRPWNKGKEESRGVPVALIARENRN